MAKLVAGSTGFDMTTALDFSSYLDAAPVMASSTQVVLHFPGDIEATVKGRGFTYDEPDAFPTAGMITSLRVAQASTAVMALTKVDMSVPDFREYVSHGAQRALLNNFFAHDDKVYGGQEGSNNLFALGGNDLLVGGQADDTLDGGKGADTLVGRHGGDHLDGGAGADVFVYSDVQDSQEAAPDTIEALSPEDVIDLRAIDANVNKSGNQAFVRVDDFTGKAGEMVTWSNGAKTTFSMDNTGDGEADMVIVVRGDHTDFAHFAL